MDYKLAQEFVGRKEPSSPIIEKSTATVTDDRTWLIWCRYYFLSVAQMVLKKDEWRQMTHLDARRHHTRTT